MKAATARAAITLAALLLLGWGNTGHRFINSRAVLHLPASMQTWVADSAFFGSHASDADYRKGNDPSEGPKHYIDLELYPNFQQLTSDLDSLKSAMGESALRSNGTLPWATKTAYDSLVSQLRRGDDATANLTASDIGHYVGDGHQPLHNTKNYNGQLSGNNGIHSRYESQMINLFQDHLTVVPRQAQYISDVFSFCLAYSIQANAYVDSIMLADDAATSTSGWSGSGSPPRSYYDTLWHLTQDLTLLQLQRATVALADLWYSAAIDAGTITSTHGTVTRMPESGTIGLYQNYPNPFNPSTTIHFRTPNEELARVTIHDLRGRTIATIMEEDVPPGEHRVTFDGSGLAGGMYIYRLEAGMQNISRKMLLVR